MGQDMGLGAEAQLSSTYTQQHASPRQRAQTYQHRHQLQHLVKIKSAIYLAPSDGYICVFSSWSKLNVG